MPRKFHKYKLLLDENMPGRQLFARLNELYDVKHIRDDLNSGGISDPQVYALATKLRAVTGDVQYKRLQGLSEPEPGNRRERHFCKPFSISGRPQINSTTQAKH